MFRLVRKLGKFIRGGAAPLQIFLAAILGMMVGFVPGFNATTVLGIVLILLLNVSLGVTLLSFAIGKALSYPLAPVTFRIGYHVIHSVGLEGFFRATAETPVVAFMDLHYYCLVGGLIVGAAGGAIFGVVLARFVIGIRKGLIHVSGKSSVFQAVSSNPVSRFLAWLIFGKAKRSLAESLTYRAPLIRKSGVIAIVIFLGLTVGGALLAVDYLLADALADAMGQANGAEVNIDRVELSLTTGKADIRGLQVTDPGNPSHNLVQVRHLTSDVSIRGLLTKRVIVDLVDVRGVRDNVPRQSPGEVYRTEDPLPDEERQTILDKIKLPGEILFDYFENPEKYDKYLRYLEQLKKYLEQQMQRKKEEVPDPEEARRLAIARGYFALSARHLLAKHPTVVVRKVVVEDIVLTSLPQFPLRLDAGELSTHPALNPGKMFVHVGNMADDANGIAVGQTQRVRLDFGFHRPDHVHQIDVLLTDLPMPRMNQSIVPINLVGGKVNVAGGGTFSVGEGYDIPVAINVRHVEQTQTLGRGMLGMAESDLRNIFAVVSDFDLGVKMLGPINAPVVLPDARVFLTSLTGRLKSLGKTHLVRITTGAAKKVVEELGQGAEKLLKGTGNIFENLLDPNRDGKPGLPIPDLLNLGRDKDKDNDDAKDGDGDKKSSPLDDLLNLGRNKDKDPNQPRKPGLLDGLLNR